MLRVGTTACVAACAPRSYFLDLGLGMIPAVLLFFGLATFGASCRLLYY